MASADISTNLSPIFVSLDTPSGGYTSYDLACGSSFLALTDANAVVVAASSFKVWLPSRGGSNWYNIIALRNGTQRYLSTNAAGAVTTVAADSGDGFQRWLIPSDGSIQSLKPTSAGTYLNCQGTLAAQAGAGKWTIAGWNFGQANDAGSSINVAATFFGNLTAMYLYVVFSVLYAMCVLILLGVVPQPVGRHKDPH